jgi:unsaturated rhamnogalacturonyl hydrolase
MTQALIVLALAVADRLITTDPASYPFNWGEGVQMIGLMKIYERTGQARYADYAEKWAALYTRRDPAELLNGLPQRPGYCGHWSPGTALYLLHQSRKKPEHLRLARDVVNYIREKAERSPDGALGHWQGSHQLWVDTLYMACPLLVAFGYHDDAANQIVQFARRLQEEKTGLFYHMRDWQTGERTPDLWGRGNGWVLMSLADTLEGRDSKPLRDIAVRMARGLEATQDRDGLWHTVLDDPESYPESSATMMICYGLLKLVRLGVLPRRYRAPAHKAWQVVSERYVKDGVVVGVSAGTGPGNRGYYKSLPRGSQTWGTGAYLMAASEVAP